MLHDPPNSLAGVFNASSVDVKPTRANVGMVGLGAMGESMARHLARTGVLCALSNRTHARAEALASELGVTAYADPGELAGHCTFVFSCVPADADVLELATRLAANAPPGFVLVDTSTIAPATARRCAGMLREVGADFVDAPVSGGVEGARNGSLAAMVGGEAVTLDRVRPHLRAFSTRVTHMGGVGCGQSTKAVNQVLVAGIAQGVCEGLALGEALGLDQESLLATLGAGAAGCWFLERRGASMLENRFDTGFKLALLHKDLGIVAELAESAGTSCVIAEQSRADYAALMAEGYGDEDISALIRRKRQRQC